MISGYDIILKSSAASEFVFEQAALISKQIWANAVVENGDTGDLLDPGAGDWSDVFSGVREIMIYRDRQSRDSWDEDGATPSNQNTMVHVIKARPDRVTVIVDDPHHSDMSKIVRGLRRALTRRAPRAPVGTQ
ncbi:MAG: hypothetical protein ABSE73_22855 [Planctomycetota bacterium]